VVFLGPRANGELVSKSHVALHASHAVVLTLKISPYNNVTLTFDYDFGLELPFNGEVGEGALHQEERKQLSNKENLNLF
jgi:hypothetical protein